MEELLIDTGLTKLQAQTYLYLLKNGSSFPGDLTSKLNITRTNTYKVLESLEKLGLVTREEKAKKIVYAAEDPIALASLVAEKRNGVIALETSVNNAMQQLRLSYSRGRSATKVMSQAGKQAIENEYTHQAQLRQPIYFIKTRADIPFMGYETMHQLRSMQGSLSPQRYGIIPDAPEASPNTVFADKTRLTRTWRYEKDYTAPVEWSVSGDSLVAQVFDGDGRTIVIKDELVAESFRQIWQMLDKALRSVPGYDALPHKAKRSL